MYSIIVFAHNTHIDEILTKASMLKTSNELFNPSNIMGSMPFKRRRIRMRRRRRKKMRMYTSLNLSVFYYAF